MSPPVSERGSGRFVAGVIRPLGPAPLQLAASLGWVGAGAITRPSRRANNRGAVRLLVRAALRRLPSGVTADPHELTRLVCDVPRAEVSQHEVVAPGCTLKAVEDLLQRLLLDGRVHLPGHADVQLRSHQRELLRSLLAAIAAGDPVAQVHALADLGDIPEHQREGLASRAAAEALAHGNLWREDPVHEQPRILGLFSGSTLRLEPEIVLVVAELRELAEACRAADPDFDLWASLAMAYDPQAAVRGWSMPHDEVPHVASAPAAHLLDWTPSFRDLFARLSSQHLGDGLLPAAAFIGANAAYGLGWAMAAATGASGAVVLYRHRRGERTTPLVWITLTMALIRGTAGILTQSSAVYFGPGIVTGYLTAAAMAVSVLVRRPVLGLMVNAVWPLPPIVRRDPQVQSSFVRLTAMWGLYAALSTTFQLWLLVNVSPSTFVAVRTVTNPLTTIPMIALTLFVLRRTAARGRCVIAEAMA